MLDFTIKDDFYEKNPINVEKMNKIQSASITSYLKKAWNHMKKLLGKEKFRNFL